MDLKAKLWKEIEKYPFEEQLWIKKAFFIAQHVHKGQKRKSGEDYIIHPIEVSRTLIKLNCDVQTVCAGLLHDVVEDTNVTYDDLAKDFDYDVANLVEGVTKINAKDAPNKRAQKQASTRKLMTYFEKDVRVIVIKLADRMHNMQTLQYMKPKKQIEISYETLHDYVPFAYKIGAYEIKNILEDLSYKYLQPKMYQKIEKQLKQYEKRNKKYVTKVQEEIKKTFASHQIPVILKLQTKNIFGISKKLHKERTLSQIHDLFGIQVLVETKEQCYEARRLIHQLYSVCEKYEHDYIATPKTNKYQSLHTTVMVENQYIQFQIRTQQMDLTSSKGLIGYWSLYGSEARKKMQQDIELYGFRALWEMNQKIQDNEEFLIQIRNDVFGKQIFVYDSSGIPMALPAGSTPVDFAYKIHTEVGSHIWKAVVNGKEVPLNQPLQMNDYVIIKTHEKASIPQESMATTYYAKEQIRKLQRKRNVI